MIHILNKPLIIFLAVALLPAASLQAQPDQGWRQGPPDAEMRVARLTRALELSDEQSLELLKVFQAIDAERQALRQQATLQMTPQICELQLETVAEINRILDEDQMARLEDFRAKQKPARAHGSQRRPQLEDCSNFEAGSS